MSVQIPETATKLRALLRERGLAPNKRFGQNFVIEPTVFDLVIRLADLAPDDIILEVGTGVGSLTHRLTEVAALVVSVEIDAGMYALARDLLGNRPNLRLIHGDILEKKSSLNPEVCEKLDVALVQPQAGALKLVANLPYNVSTPFLASLLVRFGPPDLMVVMVQKELADNLSAKPGSKAYSPLSILLQLLCEISVYRTLKPEVFWPKPRVDSAVVVAKARGESPVDALRAFPLMQYLFRERRKAIAGVLRRLPLTMGGPLTQEVVEAVLGTMGLSGTERAESLPPERFIELDRALANCSERG